VRECLFQIIRSGILVLYATAESDLVDVKMIRIAWQRRHWMEHIGDHSMTLDAVRNLGWVRKIPIWEELS
jgi:hypothetical protein